MSAPVRRAALTMSAVQSHFEPGLIAPALLACASPRQLMRSLLETLRTLDSAVKERTLDELALAREEK